MLQAQEQDETLLIELGLTPTEAKAYLALNQTGGTQIPTLAKLTGIHREYLYQIVHSLENKGLVKRELGLTSKFKAVSIEETLSMLLNSKQNHISRLQTESQKFMASMKQRQIPTNQLEKDVHEEHTQFVILPGNDVIVRRMKTEIQTAQTSIDIISTQKRFLPAMFELGEDFLKAMRKGAKIRVITEDTGDNKPITQRTILRVMNHPNFEVRYFKSLPEAIVTIFDKKHAFVTVSIKAKFGESSRLWSNNESLLALAQSFFESKWKDNEKNKHASVPL